MTKKGFIFTSRSNKTFFHTFKVRHISKEHNSVIDILALGDISFHYAMFYIDFIFSGLAIQTSRTYIIV